MTTIPRTDTGGDTVRFKPALRSMAARGMGTFALAALMIAASMWWGARALTDAGVRPFPWREWLWWGGWALAGVRLLWELLVWLSRTYEITRRHARARAGVLTRVWVEMPLENVQQMVVHKGVPERMLGIGTVLAMSAGSQVFDLVWAGVGATGQRLRMFESRVIEARGERNQVARNLNSRGKEGAMVIGLVGGVGAGKSAVARVLGEMGYLVIDADRDAKAALDRPEVVGTLVGWWGKGVLKEDGRVDRARVAEIVFSDAKERAKLEGLIHPLVKSERAGLLRRAAEEGRPGAVIDAPLLFEAGSDAECDAVIFVDAPRHVRAERVQRTRGWSVEELERREKAQVSLEEKRRRSDAVVVNDAGEAELEARVRGAERALREGRRAPG